MKFNLQIKKLKSFNYPFAHSISYKEKIYTHTKFALYEFSFMQSREVVFQTNLHVNLLPLFWDEKNANYKYTKNLEIDLSLCDMEKALFALTRNIDMPKNYQFTLELALFKFLLFKNSNPYSDFFSLERSVKSAILMNANKQTTALKNKFIKVKIGINNFEEDREIVKELSQNNRLRLDANQSLTPSQLDYILSDINPSSIDSIEEPFLDINDWTHFKLKEQYSLAVDESLDLELSKVSKYIKYYIFKPSYNISISEIFSFLSNKNFESIVPIISSSYEYEDSFNFLIKLASFCDEARENLSIIHGLGTYKIMNQTNFCDSGPLDEAIKLRSFPLL